MKNHKDETRDGKKPRSESLTWHGLHYTPVQMQHAKYEADDYNGSKPMTSEILGHHHQHLSGEAAA